MWCVQETVIWVGLMWTALLSAHGNIKSFFRERVCWDLISSRATSCSGERFRSPSATRLCLFYVKFPLREQYSTWLCPGQTSGQRSPESGAFNYHGHQYNTLYLCSALCITSFCPHQQSCRKSRRTHLTSRTGNLRAWDRPRSQDCTQIQTHEQVSPGPLRWASGYLP